MTGYLVPAGFGQGEYSEKRSRFIASLWPVESEEEAVARVEETRKKYYDARHNVWAYALRCGQVRYSDDGEPQGTGGQPVLTVFRGGGIENFCCVVTRYFGGVLLGTGGLSRAYSAAAKAALENAGVSSMALWKSVRLSCPYNMFERVRRLLNEHGAVIEGSDFGAQAEISAAIPEEAAEGFAAALTALSSGALSFTVTGESFRGVKI